MHFMPPFLKANTERSGTFQLNDKCEKVISGTNLYDNCHQLSPLDGEQGQLGGGYNGAAEGQPPGKLQLRLRARRFIIMSSV